MEFQSIPSNSICIEYQIILCFSIEILWDCVPGQGQSGKSSEKFSELKTCQNACAKDINCVGIDYTEKNKGDKCRTYPENTPRTDPGGDDRKYCNN